MKDLRRNFWLFLFAFCVSMAFIHTGDTAAIWLVGGLVCLTGVL